MILYYTTDISFLDDILKNGIECKNNFLYLTKNPKELCMNDPNEVVLKVDIDEQYIKCISDIDCNIITYTTKIKPEKISELDPKE